jgi:hypothetical protein
MSIIFKVLLWTFALIVVLVILAIYGTMKAIEDYVIIQLQAASLKDGTIKMISVNATDPRIPNIAVGTQFGIYRTNTSASVHGNTATVSQSTSSKPELTGTIQSLSKNKRGDWDIIATTSNTTYKFMSLDQIQLIL